MLAALAILVALGLVARRAPGVVVSGEADTQPRASPEERLLWLAIHESGHAVVAWSCPFVGHVSDMFIEPTKPGEAALWQGRVDHDWKEAPPEVRLAWDAILALSGLAAETLCLGRVRTLLMRDVDEAVSSARALCRSGAPWPSVLHAVTPSPLPFQVRCTGEEERLLRHAWSAACGLVARERSRHARLVTEIATRRRLSERDLAAILGPR